MNEQIIAVQSVSKSFGENSKSLQVLEDLSLNLNIGESVGLVGASGSGKSTLLHIICGLEQPDAGNIFIKDVNITDLNADERSLFRSKEVGFVYQFHHLLPDLTALENVALPAMLAGLKKEEALEISASLLKQVNLNKKEKNRPNELSGGERQRVVIAKAVAQDPMLFLLDEPTSDLDLRNQVSIMKKIRHIVSDVESGKSAIVAIHDINMAARFADRVVLLDGGSIKADGTPSEVLTEANIADVFGVSCDIIPKKYGISSFLQVLVKDEIEK